MKVFIGADHRGFALKETLVVWLVENGYEVVDCGAESFDEEDDYVDYAVKVAKNIKNQILNIKNEVSAKHLYKGIVICGSGVGVCVVANKFKGVRCGLGVSEEQVREAREDDDINVLALAGDYVGEEGARKMVKAFLETEFTGGERHVRRLEKLKQLESRSQSSE
jgi:ribose 5-phosphate isomerase B